MRFDEIDGDVVEEPSAALAAARALKRAGSMGFSDEAEGALEHYLPRLSLPVGEFFDPRVPTPAAKSYTQARDNARAVDDITREAHPYVSGAVEFGTSLVHPLNKVGGKGLIGAMKGGALQGGIQGLGDSRADLTDGDIENYARAFQDTSNGANYGAAFGAVGHGVGYGVRGLGRKVGGAIDSARESLFREEAERGARELAEADAPRIAQREAEAAARAKEQAAIDKAHGDALQKNKEMNARAAKEAERAAQRASRQPREAPPEMPVDPEDTRLLNSFKGSARNQRIHNSHEAANARRGLSDPSATPEQQAAWRDYVEKYGGAIDEPLAYERRVLEKDLRKKFPADVVDRIMAERVGPDGSIRSRGETPTVAADISDFQKNGWAERAPRAGGGGSAWDGGYTPRSERPTQIVPPEPKTDVALMRTSGDPASRAAQTHSFEFQSPKDGRRFEVEVAYEPDFDPAALHLNYVRPLDVAGTLEEAHKQAANSVGPGLFKKLTYQLRKEFPEAEVLLSHRVTGANPGHRVDIPLPEVTHAGVPEFPPDPTVRVEMPPEAPPPAPESLELPPMEEVTNPGAPHFPPEPIAGFSPVGARPQPRAGAANYWDFSDKAPAAVHEAPTRGGPSAPVDAPPPATPTVAGRRPQAPVAEPIPPPVMDAAPDKTPVQRPTWMPQAPEPGKVPRYGSKPPTDEEIVYKYLGSLESPAMQRAQAREASAFGELARKGGQAALDADNPFSAAMRGPWAVTREAIRNPAVRARALSALRLRRLSSVDPETWGRVGRALEQALMQGPEEYAAAVHVYNQTDPGFREAQRKASQGLEDMDDARLEQELRAAGLL